MAAFRVATLLISLMLNIAVASEASSGDATDMASMLQKQTRMNRHLGQIEVNQADVMVLSEQVQRFIKSNDALVESNHKLTESNHKLTSSNNEQKARLLALEDEFANMKSNQNLAATENLKLAQAPPEQALKLLQDRVNLISDQVRSIERTLGLNLLGATMTQTIGQQLQTLNTTVTNLEVAYKAADAALSSNFTAAMNGSNTELIKNLTTAFTKADDDLHTNITTSWKQADREVTEQLKLEMESADNDVRSDLKLLWEAADTALGTRLTTAFEAADTALGTNLTRNLTTAFERADRSIQDGLDSAKADLSPLKDAFDFTTRAGAVTVTKDVDISSGNLHVWSTTSIGKGNVVIGINHTFSAATNSFISGKSNTIACDGCSVAGGQLGVATGTFSAMVGGEHGEARGASAVVLGGLSSVASASRACALGGDSNHADHANSMTIGGRRLATAAEDDTKVSQEINPN